MNYALIRNGKVVILIGIQPTNIANWDACVPCNLNVQVGDDYRSGRFFRNGEEVLSDERLAIIALNEQVDQLQEDNDSLMDMLYEADGGTPVNESDN